MPSRNKILIVGPPKSGKLTFIKGLTGTVPSTLHTDSHAGLIHQHRFQTKYYSADVDIYVDEYKGYGEDGVTEWAATFCSTEAREVRDVLGAVIFTFDPNSDRDFRQDLAEMAKLVTVLESELWDGVCIAASKLKLHNDIEAEMEQLCMESGFEYISLAEQDNNTQGETIGITRAKEALESYGWGSMEGGEEDEEWVDINDPNDGDDELDLDDFDIENLSEHDREQIAKVITSLNYSRPIINEGSEQEVENLEKFMTKLKLARDNTEMSKHDRKRLCNELAGELISLM